MGFLKLLRQLNLCFGFFCFVNGKRKKKMLDFVHNEGKNEGGGMLCRQLGLNLYIAITAGHEMKASKFE